VSPLDGLDPSANPGFEKKVRLAKGAVESTTANSTTPPPQPTRHSTMGKKRPAAASRDEPAKRVKQNAKSRDHDHKGNKKSSTDAKKPPKSLV
jgi:hypothetical protein